MPALLSNFAFVIGKVLGSATGAGCRRDAATRDAPAHLARHMLVVRSHLATLGGMNCASTIRRSAQAVN